MRRILVLGALCGVAHAEPRAEPQGHVRVIDGEPRLEVMLLDISHDTVVQAVADGLVIARLNDGRTFVPTKALSFAKGPDSIAIVIIGDAELPQRDVKALLPKKSRTIRMPNIERGITALESASETIRVLVAVDGPKLDALVKKRVLKANIDYASIAAEDASGLLRDALVVATRRTYLTFTSDKLPRDGKDYEVTIRFGEHEFDPLPINFPRTRRRR